MITKRNKLGKMNGYDNIMKIIDFYLPAISIYEKLAETLEIK